MNHESFRKYCLAKKGTTESLPFDDKTLVFKVLGKMYALVSLDSPVLRVSLKCEPELAEELRARYEGVIPGYHMNKRYWNTVTYDDSIGEKTLKEWIDHSYSLVVKGLSQTSRNSLGFV